MKDRFAAAWNDDIADQRHKGTRFGTLWMKPDEMTGDATITVEFLNLPGIARADVLKDAIGVLEQEYALAVAQISEPQGR